VKGRFFGVVDGGQKPETPSTNHQTPEKLETSNTKGAVDDR
jgi:hypothetical protein